MNSWLARLSLSFFILAAALGWSAYQALLKNSPGWQVGVDMTGAAAALTLGVTGIKIRHQR